MLRSFGRSAVVAVAVLSASLAVDDVSAQTQEGFALNRFDPAPAGDPFFGVQSPHTWKDLRPSFVVMADYAHSPLVLRTRNGDEVGKIVSDQLFFHAAGSVHLGDRIVVHANVPFVAVNQGGSPVAAGTTFTSPSSAALGDVRLGARLRLIGEWKDPLQVALATSVWVPTGDRNAFAGDGRARFLPSAIVGGRLGDIIWTTNLGFNLRPERTVHQTPVTNEVTFGAGVAYLAANDKLQIGPEVYGTTAVGGGRSMFARSTTTGELLFGLKYRPGPFVIGAAAGPGLGVGLGTPDLRVVGIIGYAPWGEEEKKPEPPPPIGDRDGDGIPDNEDACPDVPGVRSDDPKKNGCPPDKDGDGIIDKEDACPAIPGVADPDPKKNGCPPDKDDDGIIDSEDACPEVKGVRDDDPKKNGCPPDKDGDGIPDAEDACPADAGPKREDPKTNGCPDRDGDGIVDKDDACPDQPGVPDPDPKKHGCPKVILTKKAIVITEQIHFEYNKATIMPDSDALLQMIAKVFKEHPEIKKVQIEGHTDNIGGAAFNMTLSQKRADAVKKWLVDHGVEADRLVSKGFGLTKPVADNKTPEGREKNRRVEFNILDPKPPKNEEEANKPVDSPSATPAPTPAPGIAPAAAPETPTPAPKPAPKAAPKPAPKAPAPKPAGSAPAPGGAPAPAPQPAPKK